AGAHVEGDGRAHFLRQLQAVGVDVGDDDESGAGVLDDGGGHDADRAGAGDQHVLAEQVERQGRVHRVAERVEDRGDVGVDAGGVVPDVGHRQGDELGERAGAVDADADGVGAEVASAGQAVAAAAADDVALAADHLARVEVGDVGPDA